MKSGYWQEVRQVNNRSLTENGSIGYATSGHALLDLHFQLSSLRDRDEAYIAQKFMQAYYEDPEHALKWMFYIRDIREGLGERRAFRACLSYLADSHPRVARGLVELVPEYGRFDDLLPLLETELKDDVADFLDRQLTADLTAADRGEDVSLLGKWLPSDNASSKQTRVYAAILKRSFGMTGRDYRAALSKLRACIDVTEKKMSDRRWEEIDYNKVPAKANLRYDDAFVRNDRAGREKYYCNLISGDDAAKIAGIQPYEIVHRLIKSAGCYYKLKEDLFAEILWEKLMGDGYKNDWGLDDCIVVADGSGSMYRTVPGASAVMAIEVCEALAIYFAGQLKGELHDKAITFSRTPQLIDLAPGKGIREKLEIMLAHNEVANTDIEAVFDLLLETAIKGQLAAEDMPGQVLIISDMEFDAARAFNLDDSLFDTIEKKFHDVGYRLPQLIFWNVCGRTNTIPKIKGDRLRLISGFSQNAAKVACDRKSQDPYEALIKILDSPRYDRVCRKNIDTK